MSRHRTFLKYPIRTEAITLASKTNSSLYVCTDKIKTFSLYRWILSTKERKIKEHERREKSLTTNHKTIFYWISQDVLAPTPPKGTFSFN